jgi:hypothetical protein
MHLQNRWGTPIDPVPFFVVVLTALATCYSFGPIYLLTFDVALPVALAVSTVVFLGVVGAAFYRLVWTYRPAYREEVPVGARFRRLVVTTLAATGLLVLLVLPLFTEA